MKQFRFTALVLAGALTLGLLAACGGGQEPAPESTPPISATPTPLPAPTPKPGAGEDEPVPGGDT